MRTTKEVRSRAHRLSEAVLAGYQPERTEIEEMAATICDAVDVFRVHYPVIFALKKMIRSNLEPVREFTDIYNRDLLPAMHALYAFDREMSK